MLHAYWFTNDEIYAFIVEIWFRIKSFLILISIKVLYPAVTVSQYILHISHDLISPLGLSKMAFDYFF